MKKILTSVVILAILMLWGQNSRAGTLTWDLQSMYGSISQTTIASAIADAKNHFLTNPDDIIIVEIAAGTYNIGGNGSNGIDFTGGLLSLGAKGRLIFKGAGMYQTTLIFTEKSEDMINGSNVYHLEFRDMFMTRSQYSVSQGTVVSVSPGAVILDIAPGFPSPENIYTEWSQGRYLKKYDNTNKLDPQIIQENNQQVSWGYRNPNYLWPVEDANVPGRWTMYLNSANQVAPYSPGDYIGIKSKSEGHIYWFSGGNDLVFRNIRWRNSSRGLVRGGFSNVGLYGCRIEREDAINGQAPCMSTPSGGPQMNQDGDIVSTNMVLENCFIDSPGDDNIAFFHVDGGVVKNCTIRNGFARGILATTMASNICVTNTAMENAYLLDESVTPIAQYWSAADAVVGGGAFNDDCAVTVTNDEILSISGPEVVNPGESILVQVDYEASTSRNIHVIFEEVGGAWISDRVTTTVAAGTGSIDVPVSVYSTALPAIDAYQYRVYITPDNSVGWVDRLHNLSQSGIDVVSACSDDLPWSNAGFSVVKETRNYSSGAIDISCASSVTISLNIEGVGPMENTDYCKVYYKVDGGVKKVISENVNSFALKTVSVSGVTGNSIEIIVNAKTSTANEIYYVSNLSVTANGLKSAQINGVITMMEDVNICNANIYPNPASQKLYVQSYNNADISSIQIYNLQGQMLYSKQAQSAITEIDVNQFNTKGMILVRVVSEQNVSIHKVIVK